MTTSQTRPEPSRRTIVKGAAWAAPVIAVAAATPAAAASEGDANDLYDFFLTAGQVIGQDASNGEVRSNGVRISPKDPNEPKVIPAGTVITVTIEYTGSKSEFDFSNVPFPYDNVENMKAQNPAWDSIDVTPTKLVFTRTTEYASSEPTVGSTKWQLEPTVRPENESIKFTGVAVLAKGGDFPNGGTLAPLIVDPNEGTGALSGPTTETWPEGSESDGDSEGDD